MWATQFLVGEFSVINGEYSDLLCLMNLLLLINCVLPFQVSPCFLVRCIGFDMGLEVLMGTFCFVLFGFVLKPCGSLLHQRYMICTKCK